MKNYFYHNNLIGKKQLREILGWSFTNYDSMQACSLADELKYIGFKYATQAGISISIEDLRVPFSKKLMLEKANQELLNSERLYLKGKITDVERSQKIIDTWNLTSESLKNQLINFFKNYDPLNSVYIMAFSGARGNLAQVRQLVGMRGLMADPSGQILSLPIQKNFREGLTVTDYLISGYGARKGIVDTALKTANSGYLTRRLIDVAQDIVIREKDCYTKHSFKVLINKIISQQLIGQVINYPIIDPKTSLILATKNTQLTSALINTLVQKKISSLYVRSPLTCKLYRAICQKCYGWDLANENLVDLGEAIGILAGQSIGEPGTQLTMRTFHTGGVFTSQMQQQIVSPINGIIRFSKFLNITPIRTNRGENVFVSQNSGSVIIISDSDNGREMAKIEIVNNTILYPNHNQYIQKDAVIGEVINLNKEVKREMKPIFAPNPGEIIVPRLKNKLNNNRLIWLLSGNVYCSPLNSYINFYSDYKLKKNSFIFRAKIINLSSGQIISKSQRQNIFEHRMLITNKIYSLQNSKIFNLSTKRENYNKVLKLRKYYYLLFTTLNKQRSFLKLTNCNKIAKLITNIYKTKIGGTLFYDMRSTNPKTNLKFKIYYTRKIINEKLKYIRNNSFNLKTTPYKRKGIVSDLIYRTIIWVEEESFFVNCDPNVSLVKHGDFILENFEIMPGTFTKTSGLVLIEQKNNFIQTITIKSGLVYEGDNLIRFSNKLYFPGEEIFSNFIISTPSLFEYIPKNLVDQLLIRPIQLYEFGYPKSREKIFKRTEQTEKCLEFQSDLFINYSSNQTIQANNSFNLASEILRLDFSNYSKNQLSIEVKNNKLKKTIEFNIYNSINLNNYSVPKLKYKNVTSCLLIQKNQFVDQYTKLGYLEAVTSKSLEIVKIKINQNDIKNILVISNKDCINVEKNQLPNKTINDFVINSSINNHVGKIIIESKTSFIIQKGHPYFFPNCNADKLKQQRNLDYKIIPFKRNKKIYQIYQNVNLHHFSRLNISLENLPNSIKKGKLKVQFAKMFLKKNGRFYSSMIPRFLKRFNVSENRQSDNFFNSNLFKYQENNSISKLQTTLLVQHSEINSNHFLVPKLTLVKFAEYPFTKTTKSVGLYSITEDFFEQELNSVFCQTNQFIENGYTLGLLNLEKEITGDIVQGLPRIEEILEARKKKHFNKRIPNSQKKGLLTQRTSLNPNFEFCKIGIPIKKTEKINPHKLLQIYFNYYGLKKSFFCDRQKIVKMARLTSNFEGSYKCFKKVQMFILNSVQNVYKSQGVTINDKHLEVIIKQMTSKVMITEEGDTPLLKREIIDLYHIEHMNKIIEKERKDIAYYLPLLFGITRASLNNPSFISAASFQETTRVLTKAAIEGRIDWLRGLKENIIVGQLIPAGTGRRTYKHSFKNSLISI